MKRCHLALLAQRSALIICATVLVISLLSEVCLAGQRLHVFAAASTTNAISDVAAAFEKRSGVDAVCSFASSSTLAKQIENKAPADIFVSANPMWMDYLEDLGEIEPGSRMDLLGNRVVLICPSEAPRRIKIENGFDLAGALGDQRLAMGDPDHVPAGIYAKKALESLGVWKSIRDKVARSKDVRAALALVERGDAPFGAVYATDAKITHKVGVVGVFPEDSHPAVRYPVAIIKGRSSPQAVDFMKFLVSGKARSIFESYGFTFLGK